MNDKWKPISLAISIIVVAIPIIGLLTAHGPVEASFVDKGDIAWGFVYLYAYTSSVIDLYKHFKGTE